VDALFQALARGAMALGEGYGPDEILRQASEELERAGMRLVGPGRRGEPGWVELPGGTGWVVATEQVGDVQVDRFAAALGGVLRAATLIEGMAEELEEGRRLFSHDLRSPLSVMLGHSEMLSAGLQGPLTPRQRASVGAIERQVIRLDQMIEEHRCRLVERLADIQPGLDPT